MLDDDQLRLVTAAVDGELTPAQEVVFRRLLADSSEAGRLFRELADHSERLKRLPRAPAPFDFAPHVENRIDPIVVVPGNRGRERRGRNWAPYLVAASVLMAVALGAAVTAYFGNPGPAPRDMARPVRPSQETLVIESPRAGSKPDPFAVEVAPLPRPVPAAFAAAPADIPEPAPPPRRYVPDLIGAALLNAPPPLVRVEARLPFLAAVEDLDRPDVQARLTEHLRGETGFRLDLFARDPARGTELLLAAAGEAGLTVAEDAIARERLNRKLPTVWAVYTESATAEDIAKLAVALATRDRDSGSPSFAQAHLIAARPFERRDLRELLGADPGPVRPKDGGPRSVSAGTADELRAALTPAEAGEKPAILLTFLPSVARTPPALSPEIRQFTARRAARTPGTATLFVVVRPAN